METFMPPNETAVSLKLVDKNGRAMLVMSRNDNYRLNMVQWQMHRLEADGYHALCQYLGDTVMRMLYVSNPDEFAKHPRLIPPSREVDDPYGLVDALLQRSYKEQTTDYIPVIDRLVKLHADVLSETGFPENWKAARVQLLEIFPAGHKP
jgi:hypothetical protein